MVLFFYINYIVSDEKQFLLYQELQNKYMISTNFLEYYGWECFEAWCFL
jgi:hypothetical protein